MILIILFASFSDYVRFQETEIIEMEYLKNFIRIESSLFNNFRE